MSGPLMLDVAGHWLTAEDRQLLRQPEVGGLILFARNIDHPQQVRELCRAIRAIRPDILIAVDQEGGRVQRLRNGFVRLPSMGDLVAADDGSGTLCRACGWLMATEVLAAGIDFSFAPVLDLDYGRSLVIGKRAFGSDPERVTALAGAFIDGMTDAGMCATGKHFPGHGWPVADSHYAIPQDERDPAAIRRDMQPFAALASRLGGIMPAHVIYSQLDARPAGFSPYWLQQVLRGELGYQGVIFSDDLSMAGAHVAGEVEQRIDAALDAGCDMGLVCNDRSSAERALIHLQHHPRPASPRLAHMAARRWPGADYKASPQWLHALRALRDAELI